MNTEPVHLQLVNLLTMALGERSLSDMLPSLSKFNHADQIHIQKQFEKLNNMSSPEMHLGIDIENINEFYLYFNTAIPINKDEVWVCQTSVCYKLGYDAPNLEAFQKDPSIMRKTIKVAAEAIEKALSLIADDMASDYYFINANEKPNGEINLDKRYMDNFTIFSLPRSYSENQIVKYEDFRQHAMTVRIKGREN